MSVISVAYSTCLVHVSLLIEPHPNLTFPGCVAGLILDHADDSSSSPCVRNSTMELTACVHCIHVASCKHATVAILKKGIVLHQMQFPTA